MTGGTGGAGGGQVGLTGKVTRPAETRTLPETIDFVILLSVVSVA